MKYRIHGYLFIGVASLFLILVTMLCVFRANSHSINVIRQQHLADAQRTCSITAKHLPDGAVIQGDCKKVFDFKY